MAPAGGSRDEEGLSTDPAYAMRDISLLIKVVAHLFLFSPVERRRNHYKKQSIARQIKGCKGTGDQSTRLS